jgi:membrane protein implicated in regulation of membrane protease activity
VTAVQLGALATVVAIVTSIFGVVFMARASAREQVKARREETEKAIKAAVDATAAGAANAVASIQKDLTEMTVDRNYWRARADAYQEELRREGPHG